MQQVEDVLMSSHLVIDYCIDINVHSLEVIAKYVTVEEPKPEEAPPPVISTYKRGSPPENTTAATRKKYGSSNSKLIL